jgi:cobalt-zinc-cadmium efflux system membrane fusion protein
MTRITLLALLIATAAACGERTEAVARAEPPRGVVALDEAAQKNAGITVAVVAETTRSDTAQAPGVIALDERKTSRIGSLVEGIVLDTDADVGDRVKAGQQLAAMHSTVVHETWAGYRKAIADRRRAEKELAFAVAAHDRAARLYADKAVSLQDVQRADADRVAAEQALDVSRSEVRRSEEEMQHLGITNADDPTGESGETIPVKSPAAGVVLERLVTPGTTVVPGAPLYVVSDLSSLWALIEIDESLLSHVHVGQVMDVRVAAYPDAVFPGTVTMVSDIVNARTRRITVRCSLQNLDGRLKPQMYATAMIREREPRSVVAVPLAAIQTIEGRPTVFVAGSSGRFHARAIETGSTVDGQVEVRSGVQAGERIAVSGSFVLKSELLKAAAPEE